MIKAQPEHPPEVLARAQQIAPSVASNYRPSWRGRFVFEPRRPILPESRRPGWAKRR